MADLIVGNAQEGDFAGAWNKSAYTRGRLIVQTDNQSPVIGSGFRLKRIYAVTVPESTGLIGIALYLLNEAGPGDWSGSERVFSTYLSWPSAPGELPEPAQFVTGTENGTARSLIWNGDEDLSAHAGERIAIGTMSPEGPTTGGRWGPWQRLAYSYFFQSDAPITDPGGIPATWGEHENSAASPCIYALLQDEPGVIPLSSDSDYDVLGNFETDENGDPIDDKPVEEDPIDVSDPPADEIPPPPGAVRITGIEYSIQEQVCTAGFDKAIVYADPDHTTPLPNPVQSDAGGFFPPIFLKSEAMYEAELSDGNLLESWDLQAQSYFFDRNRPDIARRANGERVPFAELRFLRTGTTEESPIEAPTSAVVIADEDGVFGDLSMESGYRVQLYDDDVLMWDVDLGDSLVGIDQ